MTVHLLKEEKSKSSVQAQLELSAEKNSNQYSVLRLNSSGSIHCQDNFYSDLLNSWHSHRHDVLWQLTLENKPTHHHKLKNGFYTETIGMSDTIQSDIK